MSLWGNIVGFVRGDCAQNDATKPDYIHNKPYSIADGKVGFLADILMGGKKLTGLPDPELVSDAANKDYVDSRHKVFSATVTAAGWSGSGPYTNAVTVSGILETDHPHISPVYSGNTETAVSQKDAWGMVSKAASSDGTVTFMCLEDKPAVDIPVEIEVNR